MMRRILVRIAIGAVLVYAGLITGAYLESPLRVYQVEHGQIGDRPMAGLVVHNTRIPAVSVRTVLVKGLSSPAQVKVVQTKVPFSLDALLRNPGVTTLDLADWTVPRASNSEAITLEWEPGVTLPERPCLIVAYRYLGWPFRLGVVNPPSQKTDPCP